MLATAVLTWLIWPEISVRHFRWVAALMMTGFPAGVGGLVYGGPGFARRMIRVGRELDSQVGVPTLFSGAAGSGSGWWPLRLLVALMWAGSGAAGAEANKRRQQVDALEALAQKQAAELETQRALQAQQAAELETQRAVQEQLRADLDAQRAELQQYRRIAKRCGMCRLFGVTPV